MEAELKILFENHYLSRKEYRELRSLRLRSLDDLEAILEEKKILDVADLKEAWVLLGSLTQNSQPETQREVSPPASKSPIVQDVQRKALRVAASDTTLLLLGESGVGKSRLARFVHRNSHRRGGPFVTVSCGSIPDNLLESELFGVQKGAYTGANKSREGRFQRASGGTLFLDEIGELGPNLQVKLLRVIQEKKIEPLGSSREIAVDVRLIAATNRNLEEDVEEGRFRKDLYYRLNVVPLTLPALRNRQEDILPLAEFFLKKMEAEMGLNFHFQKDGLREALENYDWPGNIRELENCMERLCVLADERGILRAEDLPPRISKKARLSVLHPSSFFEKNLPQKKVPDFLFPTQGSLAQNKIPVNKESFPKLAEIEQSAIQEALRLSKGEQKTAAKLLGIHRNTLSRKIKEYKITGV